MDKKIILLFILLFCSNSNSIAAESKLYNSHNCDFTLQYPFDYKLIDKDTHTIFMLPVPKPEIKNLPKLFKGEIGNNILIDYGKPLYENMDNFFEWVLSESGGKLLPKNAQLLSSGYMQIAGRKAVFQIYRKQNGFKQKTITFATDSNVYIIIYTAFEVSFNKYLPQFEEILKSISLTTECKNTE